MNQEVKKKKIFFILLSFWYNQRCSLFGKNMYAQMPGKIYSGHVTFSDIINIMFFFSGFSSPQAVLKTALLPFWDTSINAKYCFKVKKNFFSFFGRNRKIAFFFFSFLFFAKYTFSLFAFPLV